MAANLLVASTIIVTTFLIHTIGLIALTRLMGIFAERSPLGDGQATKIVAMLIAASGLIALLTTEIWIWAIGLLAAGAFENFGTALYFSTATFATAGFGDVMPTREWRLLAAIEGLAGFLVISWSAAIW